MGTRSVAVLVTESGLDALPYTPGMYDSVVFLNLTSRPLTESEVVSPETTAETAIVDVNDGFHDRSTETATQYVDFLERLPTRGDGVSLSDAIHRSVSFWWVAEDFVKNSVKHGDAVNVYGRGLVVRDIVETRDLDEAIVLTDDNAAREFYHSLLAESTSGSDFSEKHSLVLSLASHFVLGIVRLCVEFLKCMVGKIINTTTQSTAVGDKRSALLFTRSKHWIQADWEYDRYYRRFPTVLSSSTPLHHQYCMRIDDEGLFTTFRQLVRLRQSDKQFVALQSVASLGTFLSVLYSHCLATWFLFQFLRDIEDRCEIDGVDVYPLIRGNIISALSTFPYSLVEFECHRRILTDTAPSVCVTPYFEGKAGRMLVSASREQEPQSPVVGIQHGPVARGKIQYRLRCADGTVPNEYALPDCIAVDGEYAVDLLQEGGFTDASIEPVGGPRYDHLFDESVKEGEPDESGSSPVVVFFGRDDYRSMASILLPVIEKTSISALLKPHPAVREQTISYLRAHGVEDLATAEIVEEDAHMLISKARVVVASYSSTAVESLALGTPVISIQPRNRLDPTPFDNDVIPTVTSEKGLETALSSLEVAPEQEVEQFLDRFFGPRDGKAAQRLADLCVEISDRATTGTGKGTA